MTLPTSHLIYLHGFRSSPQSFKARQMALAVQALPIPVQWRCPQLPPSPARAMDLIRQQIQGWPADRMAVVGSSLGGFYAHVLARQIGCMAVLLNPAVQPARDLAAFIGEHPAWHDPEQRIHFDAGFIEELRQLQDMPAQYSPRTLAVIAQGDEVLDWREMLAVHGHGQVRLIEGSDHAISDFHAHLPAVLEFLGLA